MYSFLGMQIIHLKVLSTLRMIFQNVFCNIKIPARILMSILILLNYIVITFASTYGEGKYGGGVYGIGDDTAPVISNITASNITNDSAIINWTTDEPASSKIVYGKTTSYGLATAESDLSPMVTSHVINLSGLNSCTTYHYLVFSQDSYANLAFGTDKSFKTTGCVYFGVIQLPMTGTREPFTVIELPETTPTPTPNPPIDLTILYKVRILVKDANNNPVANAKVSLYSKVMEDITDAQGIAEFTNVLPGDHRIVVEYNSLVKEQSFDLNGSETVVEMNLILPAPVNYSFQIFIMLLFAIIAIFTIRTYLIWKRKPQIRHNTDPKISFRKYF